MIFVTVGTHEQPFNRLISYVDSLKKNNKVHEKIIIQTGYSTYIPKYCEYKRLISYDEMKQYVRMADIVITHGGPSSFILPIKFGKIPIVVPRLKKYKEHVNNHQLEFCKFIEQKEKNIIVVEDVTKIESIIKNYNKSYQCGGISRQHTDNFNKKFESVINNLFVKN
ncbi:glycosyltransferase [Sporolactobacillus vineae]|uniref:glycosyltransferase n=1 Tax=Sporolactobacillus vineae TaxID=444463 RepID=UPI00037C1A22|nr:glycosyltransferase [Sporolactobacillus vineae]